ncbi:hypothetical protein CERZMDRAFT_121896 [Cercospora zeae-maydis SCOH1-5]|uniref:Zn(2)-C6 fungal-type domain-containing protein n=1 Tax=Cercospora zeae-maydis SCOH1-5 TaxID=717836 RepID=A0A6A6F9E1_9PEZI|nr:hypothetical protein CERZMDRAFT_121896 [Cercospora zeae-maydis SCOH1-5]
MGRISHRETGSSDSYTENSVHRCKQCRQAKIKCSGSMPCARCARRRDTCVFPSDEPHVSVPERYLKDLERRVARARNSQSTASNPEPCVRRSESSLPIEPNVAHQGQERDDGYRVVDAQHAQPEQSRHGSRSLDALAEASSSAAAAVAHNTADRPGSAIVNENASGLLAIHNPLVSRTLPYVRDTCGRPRYLGPSSTWAFCRRALFLLGPHSPGTHDDSALLNNDGTAFRLRWQTKTAVEPGDLNDLPAADYALYLYNSIKFRLGELFAIMDEASFMMHFERFHREPWQVATDHRLWFVEYLLLLAYGKALLSHPGRSPVPGSNFAARAMSLLPDAATLHEEGMHSIEVLALVALYFQSIDMRVTAYQYIGQALRLCYVEGIHLIIPDDVISPEFSLRCHKVFWVIYVLDRELSSLMGAITPGSEDDVSAFMAPERQNTILDKALMLRVRLSRLTATTCTTLYSVDEGFGSSFVKNTTQILHRLAEVSHEIENVVSTLNLPSKTEIPHMLRRVMLSYHHCIVLATRPLIMWLLVLSLPPATSEPQQLATPISALLHASAESATTIILMLKSMTERGLLETFLPFQLEYAFASGMLLSILGSLLPSYIPDPSWSTTLNFILDEMASKCNVVAPLRKAELEALHRLLDPVRTQEPLIVPAPNDASLSMSWHTDEQQDLAATGQAGGSAHVTSLQEGGGDPGSAADSNAFYMPWDPLHDIGQSGQQELLLELAAQLETNDFDPSFLLGPIEGNGM